MTCTGSSPPGQTPALQALSVSGPLGVQSDQNRWF